MTIINAYVQDDRALIGCDTECRADAKIHHVSKMAPFVHMNAVLAVAGSLLFFNKLWGSIHLSCMDFDEVVKAMPSVLRLALNMTRTHGDLNGTKFQRGPAGETVFLVGYSTRRGRMFGRCWHHFKEHDINASVHDINVSVHPSFHTTDPELLERLKALPLPDSPEAMARMAQEQAAIFHEHPELFPPPAHVGGTFIVAEITREGMTIRPTGELV